MLSTGQEGAEEPPRVSQPHVCWGLWPRMLEYAGIGWMTLFISVFTIKTANLKTSGFVEKPRVFFIFHVFVGF
jgi:hypothetical protein